MKTLGTRVGEIIGNVLIICIGMLTVVTAIALTYRYLLWLFNI